MAILGIEVNVVLARQLWPRALLTPFTDPVDLTEADRRAYAMYAQMQRHKGFETVAVRFDGRDGDTHEIVLEPEPKPQPKPPPPPVTEPKIVVRPTIDPEPLLPPDPVTPPPTVERPAVGRPVLRAVGDDEDDQTLPIARD